MTFARRILQGLILLAIVGWALAVTDRVAMSDAVTYALWGVWMLLLLVDSVLERRQRPQDWRAPEPSPGWSAAGVILATGTAGVVASLSFADGPADAWLIPLAIAGVTVTLAIIAFRFARKHAAEIGEARFETAPPRDA
ncbi:MAG: hypothetical protein C0520_05205 [Sphingopyxis sp.]|nr:hypothetical protein [Sphingopyxis sp.]